MSVQVTIPGVVRPDGTLEVIAKLDVPAGPVQVTIQPLTERTQPDRFWTMMNSIWADLKANGLTAADITDGNPNSSVTLLPTQRDFGERKALVTLQPSARDMELWAAMDRASDDVAVALKVELQIFGLFKASGLTKALLVKLVDV